MALKFLAWNLTEYTRVFHSDTDVCMQQDPLPWAAVHERLGTYFAARHENAATRGYNGMNAHFLFLQPNAQLYWMLSESARTASFIPHTNCDQDMLETVFAIQPRSRARPPSLCSQSTSTVRTAGRSASSHRLRSRQRRPRGSRRMAACRSPFATARASRSSHSTRASACRSARRPTTRTRATMRASSVRGGCQ